jgi:hypothetical protein
MRSLLVEIVLARTDCPKVFAESRVLATVVHKDFQYHLDPASQYRRLLSHPRSHPVVSKGYSVRSISLWRFIIQQGRPTSAALLVISNRSRSALRIAVLLVSASAPVMIPPKGTSGSFGSDVSSKSSMGVGILRRLLRGTVGCADFGLTAMAGSLILITVGLR